MTDYDDNPPVSSLADEEDELDASGLDFKAEAISDDEVANLIETEY